MRELIFYVVALIISGGLFSSLSIKFNWSIKLWNKLNTKLNNNLNGVLWLILAVGFQIIVMLIAELFLPNREIVKVVTGIAMGFSLAFMPSLSK